MNYNMRLHPCLFVVVVVFVPRQCTTRQAIMETVVFDQNNFFVKKMKKERTAYFVTKKQLKTYKTTIYLN